MPPDMEWMTWDGWRWIAFALAYALGGGGGWFLRGVVESNRRVREALAAWKQAKAEAEAPWCAPGDRQEDVWIIRFEDRDRAEMIFTGPDAEAEATKAWDELCGPSGTWNGYLFALVRLEPKAPEGCGG